MKKIIMITVSLQFYMIYLAIRYAINVTINGPLSENALVEWGALSVHAIIAIILVAIVIPDKVNQNKGDTCILKTL